MSYTHGEKNKTYQTTPPEVRLKIDQGQSTLSGLFHLISCKPPMTSEANNIKTLRVFLFNISIFKDTGFYMIPCVCEIISKTLLFIQNISPVCSFIKYFLSKRTPYGDFYIVLSCIFNGGMH